ncbi:ABC transporter permease [Flavilitoribacter nigricans]|uniref:ABC transporter permease n=1 Tax=Flavilitoribacter nigricans (strain ATCC 23147 / DSM 23189 / NBRC 102662 / NCIMB 1420 / SS-2) TaxID=1122177 RepID=A0A2D0MZT6_FLAN2|nr:ABC transporter permease [Flavilitoribacter nigricans]PHN00963.1 ABC transporter permease [Flavilitoribacter nigricans DSM 23189 = NBRC 102662]
MFNNYLKITFRQILKNKTASLINYAGLSIGLAAAMIIGLFVYNEWQTDKLIPEPDRTYRLLRVSNINNEPYDIGITSAPFAPALEQDFAAEVAETVRLLDGGSLIELGEKRFQEDNYFYADANFLTFFDLPLLYGDPGSALKDLHNVVVSKAIARKYFGDEKLAMGETIRVDNSYDAVITGVLDELPGPMHFQPDLVESTLELAEATWWSGWWNNNLCTYMRLKEGRTAADLAPFLPGFMDKYFGEDFQRNGNRIDLRLQAVRDIYFAKDIRYDPMRHGNRQAVNIFFITALLLIVIACANYINLATAKAVERSKEVSIHKVLGSGRMRIVAQMLSESLMLTSASVLTAALLTKWAMPGFEQLFAVEFAADLPIPMIVGGLLGLTLIVSLLAGLYPGWMLSSFRPAFALRGSTQAGNRNTAGLRKGLIIFQFALSVGLLCSTIFVRQQLNYLQNKELGFDKEHVLLLPINNPDIYNKRENFRQQLLRDPGVQEVAFLSGVPGGDHDATSVQVPELNQNIRMRTAFVDLNVVSTLGLEIVAGRDFNPELSADSTQVVMLNERAVADLGTSQQEIIGKRVVMASFDTIPRTVIGVVRDYHFTSLHDAIEPLIISPSFWARAIAVKAEGSRIPQIISAAETAWNAQAPDFPFEYQFLDERLDRLYQSEAQQGRLFALFAGIAIFIACLGMFGLASFAAATRTKEVGIRKVLGASIASIVSLLSIDFIKLIVIAMVIASPIVWYFMQDWLQNFAYRIDLQWWVFIAAGLGALVVAMISVSYQSIRAAVANPVESLKNE